jgi:hypothetical protein
MAILGIVTSIQLEQMENTDGYYNVRFHDNIINYHGVDYKYHASGLSREVYISPCRTYVLKIPREYHTALANDTFQEFKKSYCSTVEHNINEFLAYDEAPPQYKSMIAKTELIEETAWIKQEFVEVKKVRGFDFKFREVGITKDGNFVMFDLDPLMVTGFDRPKEGFDYSYLARCIKFAQSSV